MLPLKHKGVPMVYRCTVWWVSGIHRTPVPSGAYGIFKERATIGEAMRDMTALRLTSMKHADPEARFFVNVIEYPRGYPPVTCKREIFLKLGGEDGS